MLNCRRRLSLQHEVRCLLVADAARAEQQHFELQVNSLDKLFETIATGLVANAAEHAILQHKPARAAAAAAATQRRGWSSRHAGSEETLHKYT